ncbi:unnamed protein product [Prunus armeniaca]
MVVATIPSEPLDETLELELLHVSPFNLSSNGGDEEEGSTSEHFHQLAPCHSKGSPRADTIHVNSGCPSPPVKCVSSSLGLPWQILFIF